MPAPQRRFTQDFQDEAVRLADASTPWQGVIVTGWYGRSERQLDIISGTAIWYHPGKQVPIRWVLVRDVADEFEPQGFLCTDLEADPLDILRYFVRRWSMEGTFAEVRRHLGVETQRQWSDRAISRTTPALLGLFSLVTLWASEGLDDGIVPRRAAWYLKPQLTFSDALAAIASGRRQLSPPQRILLTPLKSPVHCWTGLFRSLASPPKWPKSSLRDYRPFFSHSAMLIGETKALTGGRQGPFRPPCIRLARSRVRRSYPLPASHAPGTDRKRR